MSKSLKSFCFVVCVLFVCFLVFVLFLPLEVAWRCCGKDLKYK